MAGLLPELASFICLLAVGCSALSVDQLIPFGTANGDTIFFSIDDDTTSIAVPLRFPFYDHLVTTIHINSNGILSSEAPVSIFTPVDFPIRATNVRGVRVAFIAPFWADVDTRGELGTIFYRNVTDQETLSQIKIIVSNSKAGFRLAARFNPKWALIATWEEVGYYSRKGDKRNTFQVVVVTDELFSFTIFNYAKLTWVTGDASGGSGGFGGTAAMVGINAGDGVNFKKFKYSLTDRVLEVLNDTNMRDNTRDCTMDAFKGQYVYQIDTVPVIDDENCKETTNRPSFNPCLPESISLTPSFGAVHTGGFVVIAGPNLNTLNMATAARIRFGDDGEDLSCEVQKGGTATVICPVPLFPPDDTEVKAVTLTINSIHFGRMVVCAHMGQYRVDPPRPFLEGALMMTEADEFDPECAHDRPWSTPVLSTNRFCLTWNADEHFARDQIGAFGDRNNVTVTVTVHYMSSNTSLANHGMASGWKTINLDVFSAEPIKGSQSFVDPDAFEGRPLLMDEAALINLELTVLDRQEFSNPVPVLFFLKVSVVGTGIDMFTSSPLLSFIPKDPEQQTPMTATQCTNIIPKLDEVVVNRLPCPATIRQAFLDPSLVVDSGCVVNPSTPNKAFNCYFNPDAMQCFLQRNVSNQIVGQCCYDTKDVLLTSITGGGLDRKEDPTGQRYFEHYRKDLWPIIICCETLRMPDETCRKILNNQQIYFKASSTQGYVAPQAGVLFPSNEKGKDVLTPPSTYDNCEPLNDELQVSWTVDQMEDRVFFQICGCVDAGDYMAFGLSGSDSAVQMVRADAVVTWHNGESTGAVDYYLASRAQCQPNLQTGPKGACPDDVQGGLNNSTALSGRQESNGRCVEYVRPLNASDATFDKAITPNSNQYIVWAVGPRGTEDGLAYYHTQRTPNLQTRLRFGRTAADNCAALFCPSPPSCPYAQETFDVTNMDATFVAEIGQSGGPRGYEGITGRAGLGMAWYLNSTLIPVINVTRGNTYTFLIYGGNNPLNLSNYHPFYISDSIAGGHLGNAPGERANETVYAGFTAGGGVTVGPLCMYEEGPSSASTREDCNSTFADYFATLQQVCEAGQPGVLKWTPDMNTSDTVYYQCATHVNLGWKINVNDAAPQECPVQGQEYYDGINMCVPCTGTCEEPHIVCITLCARGCGCPVGTVLDEETKACVNVTDCPKEDPCPEECSRSFCKTNGSDAICSVPGSTAPGCTGRCHVTKCQACYYSKEVQACPEHCEYRCGEDPGRRCFRRWSSCVKRGLNKRTVKKKAELFKCVDPCTCSAP